MHTLRTISGILLTCTVTATLAACGSNSPAAPPAPAAPAPSASAASTGSAGSGTTPNSEQAVATNWAAFFDAKTPVSKRVALLQDGSQFQAIIQAQAGSSIAQQASATVTKVTLTSPTAATVSYSILLAGQPALPNQTGSAVYQNGSGWLVGVLSFCRLLKLENGGSNSNLPSVCAAA